MISKRLNSIASLVDSKDRVIDVGCDHALLDIYLIKEKILDTITISDSNKKALQNGINNIDKYHLNKQIHARLGNGLEVADSYFDTLIISGMGTNTIINILKHQNLKYFRKLIIQTNNNYYLLRKSICLDGFYVAHESVVYDKGRYYVNIVFKRGTKKYTKKELIYGPILMTANKEYFRFLLKKQEMILKHIPKYYYFKRLKHKKETIHLRRLSQ